MEWSTRSPTIGPGHLDFVRIVYLFADSKAQVKPNVPKVPSLKPPAVASTHQRSGRRATRRASGSNFGRTQGVSCSNISPLRTFFLPRCIISLPLSSVNASFRRSHTRVPRPHQRPGSSVAAFLLTRETSPHNFEVGLAALRRIFEGAHLPAYHPTNRLCCQAPHQGGRALLGPLLAPGFGPLQLDADDRRVVMAPFKVHGKATHRWRWEREYPREGFAGPWPIFTSGAGRSGFRRPGIDAHPRAILDACLISMRLRFDRALRGGCLLIVTRHRPLPILVLQRIAKICGT